LLDEICSVEGLLTVVANENY